MDHIGEQLGLVITLITLPSIAGALFYALGHMIGYERGQDDARKKG